jgi:hypothetical protein
MIRLTSRWGSGNSTYAKVVDRIRENPTRYLEELMGW